MKHDTRGLLQKAARAIHAADTLLGAGDADFAVGRAYYALFYTAEALLHEKGLYSRKHGGIHALFGEHLVKSGLMDPKFHRYLLTAFDRRMQGDYGFDTVITTEEASATIEQAREFLAEAERYLSASHEN